MDEILQILESDARTTAEEIAKLTGQSVVSVKKTIKSYEKSGIIAKYKTVINRSLLDNGDPFVLALIEVGIMPQKDVGFDHIAERIYQFPEVRTCYLMSGTYDLLVIIEGETIQTVADFVASKLSPMPHVRSTTTHFLLKKYKEDGHIFKKKDRSRRLNIGY
ncbi:MAG TPA: Lrp/AsnC family transcriptional regulator [Candidatus Omnitrophota bacterium]|jgi:DNA-binding Lrp family transcriptional regulator|nr:Lrp/AsnC family transcriptional regulator [Candidatus Omnitrophota bacterium]HSA31067.1 Lrp/AsnC family transcriptional regulator [Candidatus Omnitrophota bacterium]